MSDLQAKLLMLRLRLQDFVDYALDVNDDSMALMKAQEALEQTETTAAECRKQIENEALDKAIETIKNAVFITDDPRRDNNAYVMFLSVRKLCADAVERLKG